MDLNKLRDLPPAEAFKVAGDFAGVSPQVLDKIWETESSRGSNMLGPETRSGRAKGHFQLVDSTRATWEERFGTTIDPNDFYDSLYTAAHQVKENMRATKGNLADALRMYNSGTDRTKWDNPETNGYVSKILGSGTPDPAMTETLDVITGRAVDVRAVTPKGGGKAATVHYSDVEKGLTAQAGASAAAATILQGASEAQAVASTLNAREVMRNNPGLGLNEILETPAPDLSDDRVQLEGVQAQIADENTYALKESVTAVDKFKAAWDSTSATQAIIRNYERESLPSRDPNYDYMGNIDEIEKGYRGEELDRIREARSREHELAIKKDIDRERENNQTVFGDGVVSGLLYSLGAGVADPVGWAAGFGTAKVAQLAGISARALIAGGATARGVGSLVAEGAIGNVLVDATLDAAGEHITLNDYAISAGAGGILGLAVAPWAYRAGKNIQALEDFKRIEKNALEADNELWLKAQKQAGPDASPQAIKQAADEIQTKEMTDVLRIALAPVPEGDQLLSRGGLDEAGNSTVAIKSSTPDDITRLGLDMQVSDPGERQVIAELIVRAENFLKANPINEEQLGTLGLSNLGIESTGMRLLNSKNPVARMVAMQLLENTKGAGGRRNTAAIGAYMREKVYMGDIINEYESIYSVYRNQRGGSGLGDLSNGDIRARFDREVALYRESHRGGADLMTGAPDPMIVKASDMLDAGYNRMRIDQQKVGTVGSSRLGTESKGYMPHAISAARLRQMANEAPGDLRAIQKMLSDQFQRIEGFDQKFSDALAVKYTERAVDKAAGSYPIPMGLHNPYAGDMVRDALEALKLAPEEIERAMGRFSRGGAGFTKQRLDLDLTQTYTNSKGEVHQLVDLFDTDQMGLYRSYARRAAGEVALAQYGVMGNPGLGVLRKAMSTGEKNTFATPDELKAFDQVAAELLNSPFGTNLGKWMDNSRTLVSLSRLGGMGFTQLGEYANGLSAIGVIRTLKAIKGMPRLLKEVGQLRRGGKSANPILHSFDEIGGVIGMDGYKMTGLYDVRDNTIETFSTEQLTVVDRAIRAGGYVQGKLTMHRAIAAVQTRGMAEQIVHKAVRMLREGKDDKALADMGFSPELMKALRDDLPNLATFTPDGGLLTFDITKAANPQAARAMMQAVERGAAQIIQRTFTGETGKWAHDGFLKMLTQFRSFGITAVEKQWGRQAGVHGAARAAGYLIGAMSFALPIHFARVTLASAGMSRKERDEYLERRLHPFELGRSVLNYAALAGLSSDILDFGASAADTLSGGELSTSGIAPRGGRQGGTVAAQVPFVGWMDDLLSGNPHKTLRAMPGGNLPYVAPFLNLIK